MDCIALQDDIEDVKYFIDHQFIKMGKKVKDDYVDESVINNLHVSTNFETRFDILELN